MLRFRQFLEAYNPNEPREPKGKREGGRWTSKNDFKTWFGKSKIIDKEGKPLLVYHGSSMKGLKNFDPSKAGTIETSDWGKGVYFTPSKATANYYRIEAVKRTDPEARKAWKDFNDKAKEMGTTVMMMSIDLGFGSPKYKELQKYEDIWRKRLDEIDKGDGGEIYPAYLSIQNPEYYSYEGITDPYLAGYAKAKGHDGLIIDDMDEIIAFRPEQIRLVKNDR